MSDGTLLLNLQAEPAYQKIKHLQDKGTVTFPFGSASLELVRFARAQRAPTFHWRVLGFGGARTLPDLPGHCRSCPALTCMPNSDSCRALKR